LPHFSDPKFIEARATFPSLSLPMFWRLTRCPSRFKRVATLFRMEAMVGYLYEVERHFL
jgi:hypothetical protein